MTNAFFQFKKFTIYQDQCAMKVTTEGCVLGAYSSCEKDPSTVLDIGTGTGLLSLMVAQKYPESEIDAIEIDKMASQQARQNFLASPWNDRLHLHEIRLQEWNPEKKYDLIIANPPFFNQSLKSEKAGKNRAIHDDELSQSALVQALDRLLEDTGQGIILYPPREAKEFERLTGVTGLFIRKKLSVYHRRGTKELRVILTVMRNPGLVQEEELIIKDGNEYTEDFIRLLKPFYLHL